MFTKSVLAVLALALSFSAAAQSTRHSVPAVTMSPNLPEQRLTTGEVPALQTQLANQDGVHPMDAAPPLTRVYVDAVGSSQYNGFWEYMTTIGQASTVGDHGGAQLRVVVVDIGYSGNPVATMQGKVLPSSAQYETDPLCVNGGYYTKCNPGQTVAAWLRYFDLDGYQNGTFTYQNTSLNSPWNTLSTSIYIK